jgi:hypothetical protein
MRSGSNDCLTFSPSVADFFGTAFLVAAAIGSDAIGEQLPRATM